jgi:hypothetical protein
MYELLQTSGLLALSAIYQILFYAAKYAYRFQSSYFLLL